MVPLLCCWVLPVAASGDPRAPDADRILLRPSNFLFDRVFTMIFVGSGSRRIAGAHGRHRP